MGGTTCLTLLCLIVSCVHRRVEEHHNSFLIIIVIIGIDIISISSLLLLLLLLALLLLLLLFIIRSTIRNFWRTRVTCQTSSARQVAPPESRRTHTQRPPQWVFITGGCSRRGVQLMGVVLYNKLVYIIIQITTSCFHCTPLWWILSHYAQIW